ncbi:LacI family DNA-binding transcriptional regulator [Paenibacillus prosopidis]|uniref:LacI family transcriptional regulator n=1 Tax=Paenibacillus prosopidis TaxID=630520 RepID=A0A368VTY8_9BACL|nr:LacI family DNA-binding transcriptional regulator [Paenibacillus prosopidis]RCW45526.1 LacI family transcriptional regulator [Paenibacillus prosopidis]
MVTIYDIAAKASVSAMTVSRVINNTGKISEQTRAKVKRVMEELNYVPNQTARSLVLQQTKLLFLLITDIMNPFYTTLARGAEDAAKKSGYQLLFGNSDESLEKESDYVTTILSARVDGVLVAPAGDPSFPHMESLRKHNVPFVLLDREVPGIECDIVLGDSREGARMLVEHLVSQGHRRIAMVNGSSSISSARLRLQGYLDGHKLNDLLFDERYLYETSFGPMNDLTEMEQWIEQMDPLPTAIVAGNNVLAVEVMRLLRGRGINVPDDMSIVCFDDLGPYSEIEPFLTVAAQQAYQFGYMGMQMLIERIQERKTALPWKKIVLPADLIIRRSVKEITQQH